MADKKIVPSEQNTFNESWFGNRDGLRLQQIAGEPSKVPSLSSRWAPEAAGYATREMSVRLEERCKERARIARELHDTVFQGFFSASMVLETVVEQLPASSPSKSSLSRALRLMHRVIEEGRAALQGLRSPSITSSSLEGALGEFWNEFPFASAEFRVLVRGRHEKLSPAVQEQIYLIAREALANAFHHSNATRIEAEVEYLPAKLRVVIRDDGGGMDLQAVRLRQNSHWGLLGMQERARNIGANLRIWSRRGLGTEVEISISSELAMEARACPEA